MKHILVALIVALLSITSSLACTVCKTQQPELLKGITHGAGPDNNWDYVIVTAFVIIVIVTLVVSVWQLVKPGERNINHIKRSILNTEVYE